MVESRITPMLGVLFSRLLIPGWLITGAIFKLYYRDPRTLPESIWKSAFELGIDLDVLLRGLIGMEFVIAGIMFFSARFARPVAIALMSLFCLILLWELRTGAESCGCLGEVTMPPWLMLIIDLPLLIGAILFKPPRPKPLAERSSAGALRPWPAVAAITVLVISFGAAFGVPNEQVAADDGRNGNTEIVKRDDGNNVSDGNAEDVDETDPADTVDDPAGDEQPTEGPSPQPTYTPPPRNIQPPSYYVFEPDKWTGQHWYELDIARYVKGIPRDVEQGRRYVLFYNPTCDHCYDVLLTHFTGSLPVPTTVIAIPERKTHFETEGVYPMPCEECETLELKLGCNWITSPPVLVALENGIVRCAEEVQDIEHPGCLLWH